MKKILLLPFCMAISFTIYGQKHDDVWLFGYGGGVGNPLFGITKLDFNVANDPIITSYPEVYYFFATTDVCMSDPDGELLFFTNGVHIGDASYEFMENGINITDLSGYGNTLPQNALALPFPDLPSHYMLFHEEWTPDNELSIVSFNTEYSVIDMSLNNGLGKVVLKKENIIADTLEDGKLMAVRHANGRDWWILKRVEFTSEYYKILLSPNGAAIYDIQQVGEPLRTGLGQAVFSPDGQYYVQFNSISQTDGSYIDIYGFDRCTGELHQIERIHYAQNASSGGAAFSPNSRFLYISFHTKIYQFDMWSNDIANSRETVAVYDGFEDPFPTRFFLCQLAPNGKIYISAPNGVSSLHVIHYPDKKGTSCQVEQHGVELPTFNATSMPNNPSYRLGPLDGSPCDTLGLDNLPIAKYRYEQIDSNDHLKVEFTDLSYYEPTEWHWDFGDNATSTETDPVHTFPQDGSYEVCLTVSNQFGEHTFCRTLELGTVNTTEEAAKVGINVFPNPCRDGVNFIISDYLPWDARVVLYDQVGQQVRAQKVQVGWNSIGLFGLETGIYFYEVWEGGVPLGSGKLIKVE